jgi:hypothetical protein
MASISKVLASLACASSALYGHSVSFRFDTVGWFGMFARGN